MSITAPLAETVIPARPANESKPAVDGNNPGIPLPEKGGSAWPVSPTRRGKRRRSTRGIEWPSSVQRFFLTREGSSGMPELDREIEDENAAMVEALKTGRTFLILSEWRATVDNTTKGHPMIAKEAVSKVK